MAKREYRPHAPQELSDGYAVGAQLAEERAGLIEPWNPDEAKRFRKLATYCRMMSECKFMDEPDNSRVNYQRQKWEVDDRVLSEIVGRKPDPDSWNRDKQMALDAALAMLGEQQRVVVMMYYGARIQRKDIANALEISKRAVDWHIQEARKKWAILRQG